MRASLERFDLQLDPPLVTARERLDSRRGLLLRFGQSPTGFGDAVPLPPFTESLADAEAALQRAARAATASGTQAALEVVSETDDGHLRFPAARHAVSLALLDRRAKTAGESLSRHLGQSTPGAVTVNATVGDGSPEETAGAVADAVDAGFRTVKVKVGKRAVAADLDRLRAVRAAVGAAPEIRVDANGAWDRTSATAFLDGASDLALEAVEQPLPADQGPAHATLRSFEPAIALDESLAVSSVDDLLDAGAADRYVLKPSALGGVDVTLGVATAVRQEGATPVLSSIFESVVGRTAAVHLAAALGDLPACGLATGERFLEDLGPDPAPVIDGRIEPPTGPGLGIERVSTDG